MLSRKKLNVDDHIIGFKLIDFSSINKQITIINILMKAQTTF